jgi:hypothetical protein
MPGHDLQDEIREIDPREHALQAPAQIDEARRVGDRVDPVGVQPPVRVDMDSKCSRTPVGAGSAVRIVLSKWRAEVPDGQGADGNVLMNITNAEQPSTALNRSAKAAS